MIYTIEIRDLTNEGKELAELHSIVNSNCEIRTKKVNILAQSHISAMASYFKHLKMEIDKLDFKFFDSGLKDYDSIGNRCRLYIKNDVMKITISPIGCSYLASYVIDTENMDIIRLINYQSSGSIINYKEDLKELMWCWKGLKENINKKISFCIEDSQKANNLKEINSKEELEFFENFTI